MKIHWQTVSRTLFSKIIPEQATLT